MLSFLLYISIILFTALQSVLTKLYVKKHDRVILFSFYRAFAAFLAFLLIGIFHFTFHIPTLLWGGAFGLLLSASMYCGYKALATGPISLTSPLVALSVIIPTVYGIWFLNDPLSLLKILGFITLVFAIVFFNLRKKQPQDGTLEKNVNMRWAFYVCATFLCNGFSSIMQVEHQQAYPNLYANEFMIFAMFFVCIAFSVAILINGEYKDILKVEGKSYAVTTGLATGAVNYLTILLVSLETTSVMYPIISAGTLLAAMLSGIFIFKEKQPLTRIIGFIFGLATVILLKI